ncbi:hypothetical protein ACLKA7_006783 [Drosophila subpalustris]
MFTNWLTGSSSNSSRVTAATATVVAGNAVAAGVGGIGGVMSTPPDVILEVGPAPSSVRFVAHALVLGMHSGYLRSAIRMDEAATAATAAATTAATVAATQGASGELLLYLGNVTAEQFAPLLTYMYTGYLDLNVDNIFAVLLATHVLHMPRALEICRSYLARAQTEGYLSGQQQQQLPLAVASVAPKIIRPIASKATLPNFGFLPAPAPPPPPPPSVASVATTSYLQPAVDATAELSITAAAAAVAEEEDEDVEVFIDSNTATDNELDNEDCNVSVVSSLGSSSAASSLNIERVDVKSVPTPVPATATVAATAQPKVVATTTATAAATKQRRGNNNNNSNNTTRNKRGNCRGVAAGTSGLQVAKAPVPAMQLETAAAPATSKFIIDVASCDGPVRFRRILNTAYGHKPETCNNAAVVELQRTQQSVSYSFHQQMARAISSQQRQQQQQENENSGDTTATATAATTAATTAAAATATTATVAAATQRKQSHAELFVCVYCKHTFKSQYCYQKHAKRHLNPLSLDKKLSEATTHDNNATELLATAAAATGVVTTATAATGIATATATAATGTSNAAATATVAGADATLSTAALLLRREVRPLDMNVQYYPCKTCGSKFPSYYFVHKHRKLCHADELEATTTANNNNNSTSSSSNNSNTGISKREATTATATVETTP